jgi:hypothetical protein
VAVARAALQRWSLPNALDQSVQTDHPRSAVIVRAGIARDALCERAAQFSSYTSSTKRESACAAERTERIALS